eukprot:gene5758-5821_t
MRPGICSGLPRTERATRRAAMAPFSFSAAKAAAGRSRSAGSQIARSTANGIPCRSATRATAPDSRSTEPHKVDFASAALSAAVTTISLPACSIPPNHPPSASDNAALVGRMRPASTTAIGTMIAPAR